jgi:UDP-glucuronate 4-epimerase
MNILITGAAGFIGFHLAKHLKTSRNDFIIGYDNFNSYYDVNLKFLRQNILKDEHNINIVKGDIIDQEKLLKIISDNTIDCIVHLAAQAGVRHSLTHPEDYVHSNLNGFVSILEVCKKNPHIKLVYASSSSIYGLNKKIPFDVEDFSDFPTSLYGATKKANELLAHSYNHLYKIPMVGLRYFTVYGPYGRPDMAYFSFTKKILNNEPIDIFNYGKMKRDFTYIDDIVNGTTAAIDYDHKDKNFEIFNLGNNSPVKVLDFIKILESLLKKKAKINLLPMRKEEVIETFADIDKSIEKLNFKPSFSLEKGLEKFISWYLNFN